MIGLSRGYLVPILTAPLKVCKAMKNSSEHDTMSEHRETDHRMRPQFPQVEMHQPTSKTPVAPGFTGLQDRRHLTIATSSVLNGVVFRYLFLA